MELAVNTFEKGLQMDTNPMVQGNKTLSNALNATLITMNGDEVVLLNDMGNRRIDQAYLPKGFEPVGIKEYGGIIYIAAYNPITKLSLIGSFPSPLRIYKSEDGDTKNLVLDLTNEGSPFYKENLKVKEEEEEIENNSIKKILEFSHLISLIDKSLRPGDKFLTYLSGGDSNIISNWDSTNNLNNINKQYTLSYGILNSLNLFVDITKNLIRWDSEGNIISDSGNTEEDFNSGYFLYTLNDVGNSVINESSEENFEEENRLKLKLNTYLEKLVGKPYLKVNLNHPTSFSYSYKGVKNSDSIVLTITGTLKYNCPISPQLDESNQNIFTLFAIESNLENYSKELKILQCSNYTILNKEDLINNNNYDSNSNLYTIRVSKTYILESSTIDSDGIFTGYIGIPISSNYLNYIDGTLFLSFSVDTNLFGSNILNLTEWGYKKEENSITIRYTIEDYLEEGLEVNKLKLKLTDISNVEEEMRGPEVEIELEDLNGSVQIPYDKFLNLLNRHMYSAEFLYTVTSSNTIEDSWKLVSSENLWLLNTSLLNDCFTYGTSNYIKNYCNRTEGEDEIFLRIVKVKYNYTFETETISHSDTITEKSGGYFKEVDSGNNEIFDIWLKHELNTRFKVSNFNVSIQNEEKYPIDLSTTLECSYDIINGENEESIKDEDIRHYNENANINPEYKKITNNITKIHNYNYDEIKVITNFYDFYVGNATESLVITFTKSWFPLTGLLDRMMNSRNGIFVTNCSPYLSLAHFRSSSDVYGQYFGFPFRGLNSDYPQYFYPVSDSQEGNNSGLGTGNNKYDIIENIRTYNTSGPGYSERTFNRAVYNITSTNGVHYGDSVTISDEYPYAIVGISSLRSNGDMYLSNSGLYKPKGNPSIDGGDLFKSSSNVCYFTNKHLFLTTNGGGHFVNEDNIEIRVNEGENTNINSYYLPDFYSLENSVELNSDLNFVYLINRNGEFVRLPGIIITRDYDSIKNKLEYYLGLNNENRRIYVKGNIKKNLYTLYANKEHQDVFYTNLDATNQEYNYLTNLDLNINIIHLGISYYDKYNSDENEKRKIFYLFSNNGNSNSTNNIRHSLNLPLKLESNSDFTASIGTQLSGTLELYDLSTLKTASLSYHNNLLSSDYENLRCFVCDRDEYREGLFYPVDNMSAYFQRNSDNSSNDNTNILNYYITLKANTRSSDAVGTPADLNFYYIVTEKTYENNETSYRYVYVNGKDMGVFCAQGLDTAYENEDNLLVNYET